ncbi:3-hydroxybutyrate dehydrogenase [Eubacteriales bacterium KG127]
MTRKKIAIVTGAASGIGFAVAKGLSEAGVSVMMADVQEEKLREAANEIGAKYFVADLSKETSCKELVEATVKEFGSVNILANVAGIQNVAPIAEFPEDKWKFIIDLMLTAPFLLTKYCWKYMESQNWGRIVNMASIHGLVASEYKSAYVSAKHGLVGLTKTTAMEGGSCGITANAVCPAYVRTPLVDGQIADQAKTHGISEQDVIANIMLQKAAVKKMLDPKVISDMVLFLCSDSAESITGTAIPIDGGWTAN